MDIGTLKTHIKTGKFQNQYIFTGDEVKVMDLYIDMIVKKDQLYVERFDSLSEVYKRIKAKTLIQQRHLYIIRDDKEYMMNDKLWDKLSHREDSNIVIFYYTEIDKRTKFWKRFQDDIVVFDYLDNSILTKYIKKEIDLSDKNCEVLIDVCEKSYGRILLEIDKIKNFPSKDKADTIFQRFIQDGTISIPAKDAIFDFAHAVMDRDSNVAMNLLQQSYEIGEANMVLLSVLYNNVKQLLQVQSCLQENKNIVETTGLNGFQIKTVKPHVGKYKNAELVKMMRCIRKVERGIKTGEIPDDVSMNYVLVNCM